MRYLPPPREPAGNGRATRIAAALFFALACALLVVSLPTHARHGLPTDTPFPIRADH